MQFAVQFKVNEHIFLKNPERSELGRQIIKGSIDLMHASGYEHFTFKKLAAALGTTEATIYRYFENKHRLLLYILNWYWCYMEYLVEIKLQNITDKKQRLTTIIALLTEALPDGTNQDDYNKNYLNQIVIRESSKVYLVRDVIEFNKEEVFKPYKDLCAKIADVIAVYNPKYPYPRSLSTTLIESAHDQQYFVANLPRLTDVNLRSKKNFTYTFLVDMVFRVLG
jgi:AcrR family transcriptional regulator